MVAAVTASAAARVDLTTTLGGMLFAAPVMIASGCGGTGRDLSRYVDLREVGAFVTSSVTRDGGVGLPLPRTVEAASGLVSAVGLPGPGIDGFLATDLPWLLRHKIAPIVSVAGTELGDYAELARRVGNTPGIAGIEVHLALIPDPVQACRAVSVVRRDAAAGVPVFAKLWPGAHPVAELSASLLQAGAAGVVLPGSLPALAIDSVTLRPRLGAVTGDLSGPAVHTVALRAVWEVRRALPGACIISAGGVRTGADALALLAAGANAVQLGSAVLADPSAPGRVVAELRRELAAHGFSQPAEAVGVAHRPGLRAETTNIRPHTQGEHQT